MRIFCQVMGSAEAINPCHCLCKFRHWLKSQACPFPQGLFIVPGSDTLMASGTWSFDAPAQASMLMSQDYMHRRTCQSSETWSTARLT